MKHTKRLLALLLSLALAFGLALPAFAANAIDWDDFYIITPLWTEVYVPHGESVTLNMEVNIPEGVERVTYQWYSSGIYNNDKPIKGATTDTLQLSPRDSDYPTKSSNSYKGMDAIPGGAHYLVYYCEITVYDDVGNSKMLFRAICVTVEGSFLRKLYSLTLEPFVYAFLYGFDLYVVGLLLFPVWLIERYVANFKAVFR